MSSIKLEAVTHHSDAANLILPHSSKLWRKTGCTKKPLSVSECRTYSSIVSLVQHRMGTRLHTSHFPDKRYLRLSSVASSYFFPWPKFRILQGGSINSSLSKRNVGCISSALNTDILTERLNSSKGNGALKTAEPLTVPNSSTMKNKKVDRRSVLDYMEQVPELLKPDNGPPRWFCPLESGCPPTDAPILFFLPGLDSTGLGLILHQKALGRMFEVRCLHIPVMDRTCFEGLVELVEKTIKIAHESRSSRPLYIVGDSFGGLLALAVAARNPNIDLVLILANPATSYERSQLQPLSPVIDLLPESAFSILPYMLSFTMGDPIRMASANLKNDLSAFERAQGLSDTLVELLETLPVLSYVIPKETLQWKLKILHSGALYTNSRLHAIRAQVLLLISEKDRLLPSTEEGKRLKRLLKHCELRSFKDSGHTLLLEVDLNLATLIKSTQFYRKSKSYDIVSDYVLPTSEEFETVYSNFRIYRQITSPVFFSTNEYGQVQQGISGIPLEQPLLLVGNHMLKGLDLTLIPLELFKERGQIVRGIAHPFLFRSNSEGSSPNFGFNDLMRLCGAVPVSGRNLFKVLSRKQSVLLYPGGAREALHLKGEEYKLFWPDFPEFVRMAARHGATIVPFSAVGEDDILELVADYEDLKRNPFLRDTFILNVPSIRPESDGEVSNQPLYLPLLGPKVPGRIYTLFGRPTRTAGREKELLNKENAESVYLQVKSEVEAGLQYLLEKRKYDTYRNILPRLLYEASCGWARQAPTFEP